MYEEELVIIAARQPSADQVAERRSRPQPCSPSRPAAPYRKRMDDWFASSGEMSDRIIEMSSYNAMLGCAVAGMGISMVPRMVLRTFPDVKLLSVHAIPPEFNRSPTVFIWRKGAISPKVSALIEILMKHRALQEQQKSASTAWFNHAATPARARP